MRHKRTYKVKRRNLRFSFLRKAADGVCTLGTGSHLLLLLLLSHFSRVRLCVTPQTAAHQALQFLGFSRQEHWSGLPFPSPMHESEKWKGSRSVVSDSLRPHGLQPTRLLHPWDFPGKSTGVGCHRTHLNYFKCLRQLTYDTEYIMGKRATSR